MVWVRLPVYFYKWNDIFYFSRSIPSDLQHRFKKRKIEVSLPTKSESKAAKPAAALSDRLRAVECPTDIIDAISGWSTEGVGQRYRMGFDLKLKSK